MTEINQFRQAMTSSTKLMREGLNEQALGLLDEAIVEAVRQQDILWIRMLSRHASVVANFLGNFHLERQYHEQSLAVSPEDPLALYGLAKVALKLGELEVAQQHAKKCYEAILRSDNEIVKQGLTDLVLKNWPEVARK
jgi:tetratricopeptide (TPR) repeat protein